MVYTCNPSGDDEEGEGIQKWDEGDHCEFLASHSNEIGEIQVQ